MPRRVVTGVNADGQSVVASDEEVELTRFDAMPKAGFATLWGSDGPYTVPTDGTKPSYTRNHPLPGGFRSMVYLFQPESTPIPEGITPDQIMAEVGTKQPGALDYIDAEMMETTPSVDIGLVLSGEITLILENGVEVPLRQGDFCIQNGTRHSWRNKTEETALVSFTLIAANTTAKS